MTVFVDAGIFVAIRNAADLYNQRSKELMKDALQGNMGKIFTSDYVIDEAITVALARTKRHELAVDMGAYILESPRFIKLTVDEETFNLAWQKFKSLKGKGLSFTDCTTLALAEKHGIKQVMTFDSGFDGLVKRIC
jgi:hypothetical protein